jgi:microcystin-dependent protein
MAVTVDTYIPFASGSGQVATVAQWEAMARHWLKDGVILGELNEAAVFADATGLQIKVQPGRVVVRGHYGDWAAQKTLGVAGANASLTRIDRVVARLDITNSRIDLDVLTGTPGSGLPPALTQNSTTWEVSLARVSVPPGDTTVDSSQVTDERAFARPHGVEVGDIKIVAYAAPANSAELFLQGQIVSRVAFAQLFAIWGTTYGSGDGTTTFGLPNSQGAVIVGRNTADSDFATLGKTGGEKRHTLAWSEVPPAPGQLATDTENGQHSHAVPMRTILTPSSPSGAIAVVIAAPVGDGTGFFQTGAESAAHNHGLTFPGGGGNAHNVMQPYITLNYAVRAR